MAHAATSTADTGPSDHLPAHQHSPAWRWFGAGAISGILAGMVIAFSVASISGKDLKRFTEEHVPWLFHAVQTVFEIDQSAGPELGINLNEVTGNPKEFYGETVTVSGVVSKILDAHAIVLGREGLRVSLGGPDETIVITEGDELLVVTTEPLPPSLTTGMVARATGTVLPFELARIEQRFGIHFGHHEALEAWDGDGAVIAQSITLDPPVSGHGDKEDPGGTDGPERGVTITEVLDDVNRYLGRGVTLSGEAEEVLTPHAFTLSDHELLVMKVAPIRYVREETTAYVTGTVRRFERAALERELGIALDAGVFEQWEGKPVVIADSIRIVH